MRVITQHTFRGPEVLTIVAAPKPRPLPTDVLVRVRAIGLNLQSRGCAPGSSGSWASHRSSSAGMSAVWSKRRRRPGG